MFCPKCNSFYEDGSSCSKCGETTPQDETTIVSEQARKKKTTFYVVGVVLAMALAFFGTYHVVESSEQGWLLVKKVHFTWSETFVSLDAITGQPLIAAKSKYPLAIKALQRDGIIETDEQMQERVQKELEEKMNGYDGL